MEPIPKPKRRPKSKREPNPQKAEWSRVVDPAAVEAARRPYCIYCGISRTSIDYHVHHIIRRSQAGGDEPENLANLCAECHDKAHRGLIKPGEIKDMLLMDLKQ